MFLCLKVFFYQAEIVIKIPKFKMATASSIEHKIVHADKLAVFTCNDEIDERQIRFYVIDNWETLTQGMDNSTILFIAGVHGLKTGKLGPKNFIDDMKNQVRQFFRIFTFLAQKFKHFDFPISVQRNCLEKL